MKRGYVVTTCTVAWSKADKTDPRLYDEFCSREQRTSRDKVKSRR